MSITPSEYACRVARHLWSEAELSNGLIQVIYLVGIK